MQTGGGSARVPAADGRPQTGARSPGTVVVDDSAFYDHMPKGTTITEGGVSPAGAWLFNNSGLVIRSQAFLYAKAAIPEDGTYHLFVRSEGNPGSSFRVTVGGQQTSAVFGDGPLSLKPGGTFELLKGPIDLVLSRIVLGQTAGPTFDVLVLTRNPDFTEETLRSLELPDDVSLLKEYTIPRSSAVKFGDVDGDGRSDFFVLTGNYAGHMFDHEGRELWSYQNDDAGARRRSGFEAPGLVWDFDRDGFAEVVHYRLAEGRQWLVISEGRTGAIRHRTEWPAPPMPHEYNNFRLTVARLGGDYPTHILVFTDAGGTISITAYTASLQQLWQHVETKKKDHLGHYLYAVDLDGDGVDEVIASPLVLDASGRMLWERFDLFDDNHDHADSFRFHDLNGDGQPELLAPFSEAGVVVFRARDGAVLWRHPAEHAQQLEVGHFLRDVPGPHIAVTARTYPRSGEAALAGQVHWFDAKGTLLLRWPANPLNGNPDFVKGDWKGDGGEELFWYKFLLTGDGKGVLYLKQDAYHMFDFMGIGSDQVIARRGTSLQVYGYRYASLKSGKKRSVDYWRRVANHTHY